MQKWGYCYLVFSPKDDEQDRKETSILLANSSEGEKLLSTGDGALYDALNGLGSDGWEAVAAIKAARGQTTFIFKRPIEEKKVTKATAH